MLLFFFIFRLVKFALGKKGFFLKKKVTDEIEYLLKAYTKKANVLKN